MFTWCHLGHLCQCLQRITAGEFVDFMDLPPAKSWLPAFRDSQASTLAILQLQEVEKQRKLIPDYSTWSQCFAVYAAVLGLRPACFTGMAKDPDDAWCRTCQSLDHSTSSCPLMPHSKQPHIEAYAPQPEIC